MEDHCERGEAVSGDCFANDELAMTAQKAKNGTASETKIRPRSDKRKGRNCYLAVTFLLVIARGRSPRSNPRTCFWNPGFYCSGRTIQGRGSTLFPFSPTKAAGFSTSGVTRSLQRSTYEHQGGLMRGFAKRYVKAM